MTDNVFLATLAGALRDLARTDELQGTSAVLELERIAASCDQERAGTSDGWTAAELVLVLAQHSGVLIGHLARRCAFCRWTWVEQDPESHEPHCPVTGARAIAYPKEEQP